MKRRDFFDKLDKSLLLENKSCYNCLSNDNLEVHHIVPLSLGGSNYQSNFAVLCNTCHRKVHGKESKTNWKELQRVGIDRARKAGRLGRGNVANAEEVGMWRQNNNASIKDTAEHFKISIASVKRYCKKYKENNDG